MSASQNKRYGLNLNRGLYFEGVLDPAHTKALGASLLRAITDKEFLPEKNSSLHNLAGHIVGIVSPRTAGPEQHRILTKAPVFGSFALTSLDVLRANCNNYLNHVQTPNELLIEGTGMLLMTKLDLYKKYRPLLPGSEYLTTPGDVVDDVLAVTLGSDNNLRFSITVESPLTQN